MRAIKFRGFNLDAGKWVYGSLIIRSRQYGSKYSILQISHDEDETDQEIEIDFTSIGQFTGLLDKNDKDLDWWEGDILKVKDPKDTSGPAVIVFKDAGFAFQWYEQGKPKLSDGFEWASPLSNGQHRTWLNIFEKVGNIYENPDMLK